MEFRQAKSAECVLFPGAIPMVLSGQGDPMDSRETYAAIGISFIMPNAA